jgi:hypothetical protein
MLCCFFFEVAVDLVLVVAVVDESGMDLCGSQPIFLGKRFGALTLLLPPGDVVHGDAVSFDMWLTAEHTVFADDMFHRSPKPTV